MAIDFTSMGATTPAPTPVDTTAAPAAAGGLLNLEKNSLLNLDKVAPGLTHAALSIGWDSAVAGTSVDLDVSLIACYANGKIRSGEDVVFYNHKEIPGAKLDKDNRTGDGEGDDETIHINFTDINPEIMKLVGCVTIDKATEKRQTFGMVANAFARLIDTDTNKELCRYPLKGDYSTSTAVIFVELVRDNGSWSFHTIGEGLVADLNQIAARFQ